MQTHRDRRSKVFGLAAIGFMTLVIASPAPTTGQVPTHQLSLYPPAPPVTRYAAPSAALGDLNGSGVPVVSNPARNMPPVYSGAAMSPDGKILFVSAAKEFAHTQNNYLQNRGLFAAHVRHDQVTVDALTGLPLLGAGVDTPIRIIDPSTCPSIECPRHQETNFLTVIDDPELPSTLTNPYLADCTSGAPDLAGSCQGYDFQLLINGKLQSDARAAFKWEVPLANIRTGKPAPPAPTLSDVTIASGLPLDFRRNTQTFLQRRLRLTVDPLAATQRIVRYEWVDGGVASSVSFASATGNHFPLTGLEPTLSGDGRLLVWQGNPAQVAPDDLGEPGGRCFTYWHPVHGIVSRSPCGTGTLRGPPQGHGPCATPSCNQPGDNSAFDQFFCLMPGSPPGCSNTMPFFTQNVLVYAYRDDPTDPHGWSIPDHLTALHANTIGMTLAPYNGRTFHEIYPIARQPLLDGSGTPLVKINGNYCWLTLDATDVIWNAQAHIRTGIIGASTGFYLQHVDGPVNPTDFLSGSHNTDDRETFVGWGPTPGMWGPIDVGKRPIPYLQGSDRKLALYGHEVNNYVEIPLFAERPDRLLRLGMNKALRELPGPDEVPGGFNVDSGKTDDFSGRGQTGTLVGGAFFPNSHDGFNGPKSGESISIVGAGGIDVANGPALSPVGGFDRGLSVGLFVRVDANGGGSRYLVRKNGSFELTLESDGRVRATVITTTGLNLFTTSLHTLVAGPDWHHVAFTRDSTHLRLYFDGVLESTAVRFGVVGSSVSTLEIGTQITTTPADISVDDLEIWGTTWTANEVAAFAYVTPAPSLFRDNPTLPGLPAGLDSTNQAFLKIPNGSQFDLTTERVGLGRDLFNDPGLSHSSLNMACASCHQSSAFFAESSNAGFSTGSAGTLLSRQTPPVFNRAFGDTQLWDARAQSLEAQASLPILSPDEMNNTQSAVEAYIQANYATAAQTGTPNNFQTAYGTSVPDLSDLELALAAFQRAIVAGDSVIDKYEDGIPLTGPDASAILRGRKLFFTKARCAACHHGPNLADNTLHRSVVTSTDTGAGALTLRQEHQGAFKTPTLRNVQHTVDYFHNGAESTLSGVIDLYETGGVSGDPEIRPLGLSTAERADLVKFLEALDSGIIQLF